MTRARRAALLILGQILFSTTSIFAGTVAEGNKIAQEKGDVLARDLALPDILSAEVHTAIYNNYTGPHSGIPANPTEEPTLHYVIEMTGVVTVNALLQITSTTGIEQIPLESFKSGSKKYFGAYLRPNTAEPRGGVSTNSTRAGIIENAIELQNISPPIDYVVVVGEPFWHVETKYLQFEDVDQDGIVDSNEISAMRSDAFVEFCYAKNKWPILTFKDPETNDSVSFDITKVSDARAVILLTLNGDILPSHQVASLRGAEADFPSVVVKNGAAVVPENGTTKGESLNLTASDYSSGVGRLEIYKDGAFLAPANIDSLNSSQELYSQSNFPLLANLEEGSYSVRAIDQAGNEDSFHFQIALPRPSVSLRANSEQLFSQIQGTAGNIPTTIASTAEFTIHDDVGVAAVSLPQGPAVIGVVTPAGASLGGLPAGTKDVVVLVSNLGGGTHSFSATNSAGKTTQGSWRVESLAMTVASSIATYIPAEDAFTGSFQIGVAASAGAEQITRYNPTTQTIIEAYSAAPITIVTSTSTEFHDLYVSDKSGNAEFQQLVVFQAGLISPRMLQTNGTAPDSTTLNFNGGGLFAGQSGFVKPGVIRVEENSPTAFAFAANVEQSGEMPTSAPIVSVQNYGSYSFDAGGQVLISGTLSTGGDTKIVPATTIMVTNDITFNLTLTKAPFVGVTRANCLDTEINPTTCSRPRNMVPSVSAHPFVRAVNYTLSEPSLSPQIRVFPGTGQSISLGNGAAVSAFNATSAGFIAKARRATRGLEPGYINLLGDQIYEISASDPVFYSGAFNLSLAFDVGRYSGAKPISIARLDPCGLTLFPASQSEGKATAQVSGFGKFAVVQSLYASPQTKVNGACNFVSEVGAVTVTESLGSTRLGQAVSVFGSLGYAPVGTTCEMGPSGTTFASPGTVKVCYSPADLAKDGVTDDALTLYQFNGNGVREHLANMFVDRERGIVSGTVDHFSSQFSIFASTLPIAARDLLPPITTLYEDGKALPAGAFLVISATSTMSLSAVDPAFPGAPLSGVATTYILVDTPFLDTTTTPGNPYAGHFSLSVGSHTLALYSADVAGNKEAVQVVSVLANPPPGRGVGGLGIGRDAANRLWAVALDGDTMALTRTDDNGVAVASATLSQAVREAQWGVLFDISNNVYAVGTAEGASTIGADLAVYKASSNGDAIASTHYFDSGFNGGDFVFDVAAPGWMVGAIETSGNVINAALWRFSPADGNVALSTTFASGAAMGVAVDSDGSVWTAGYIRNSSPRSSRVYDLGLWHFAADGQTLLAGPYKREAYAADFTPTFAAKILISSAVVSVAVPRGRVGAGTDLAFINFNKANGAVLAESAWRPADGSSAYPAALLADGGGFLVAGGLDSGFTRAALWRYGAGGGANSSSRVAAGGARGAASRSSELWLAVDDSSAPYRVTSESALSGSLTDVLAPRVELAVGLSSFLSSGTVFVASSTYVAFNSVDDKLAVGDGLGSGTPVVYYRTDSTGTFASAASSFTLAADGTHIIEFYGVDSADNPGNILSRAIVVDRTAPVTQFAQNGAEVTLGASDTNGSGVARVRYLVDYGNPDVCNNVAEDTGAPRGTCENPWYAGPFTLSNGPHTLYFQAFDAVGNTEVLRTTYPFVESPGSGPAAGGLGIGKDSFDSFWTVVQETAGISFARANSSGALVTSALLQDGADGVPWSVFFDAAGRAYAIGMADGPGTQALDLAIYKAAPSGAAVESRTLLDGGYANNDLVFDVKTPGWIVGAVQTAGPTDFEVAGERSLSMALWRFDSAAGTVQASTSSSRAGFDFGTGIAVDADGSLWVAGYSARPNAPDVGGLDLALWHYASDGRTLLGGPFFKPGYSSSLNGGIVARVHVTGDAVYVAAPRLNVTGGSDMAFLKFGKTTGQSTVETVWQASDGSSSYPVAILPVATGLLVAGGIGNDMTDAALWRFGLDGTFQSATIADAGGALGAVFKGNELWLSVSGSTVPYRVVSEAAASGTLVDISTPAAPAGFFVNPTTGPIGIPFTIAGNGFGLYGGANTRVKFGTVAAPVSVWNNTTISGTIPGLSSGSYAVAIERQNVSSVTSVSAGNFAVTDLNSAALNVSSGPIGVPFTITGTGFGPYAGTLSRVLVDGATAPLSVWNNTTIAGTIPGVTPGAKTIVIQRAAGSVLSTSDGFAFEVTVPSVTAVSPSSGPIGAAYALTGFSFGPYAGANTRVLIGGATTALSLWSDRVIKGTVPGSLAPGVQTVVVQRLTSGGGFVESGAVYFQVAGLALASLTPSSGPIGVPFTINGTGFGAYDGANTRVKFGVSTAALSLWNDTTITGTIPALEPGAWPVVVERQQGSSVSTSSSATFTATALSVSVLSPSSGPIGVPFTITGSQFGVYGGANTRVKFNGVVAPVSVWNDSTITGTVPALSTGVAEVVVERQQGAFVAASGVSSFTVVELAPTGMTPETGPIGTAFTITGSGFGPYNGANTRLMIGGAVASLSLWNDTTISGTIPDLPAGVQPLWLERSAGTGVQSSATNYFEVTTPAVASLTPSSAPIGAPFTITGTSFGAYGGANTRVTFNGVVAALSLWNDTTITGTVPAVPAGVVDVVVERQQGAGVVASSASAFTVLEPAVGGLSPSAGPIGTAFTLTGSGFGPYAGANTRVLIGGAVASLSLWNDTTITGTIPALPSGAQPVWLERSAGSGVSSSATSYFNVTTPDVASLTPSSAPIGAPFTITGTSFGAYAGANTRVKFNGVVAPLSVWNDTTITGTVPGTLSPGGAEVIVERASGAGLAVSATQAFYVVAPAISTVSPSFGPVGTVVTVTGAGFGPYSGTLTRLLVGGTTVPLSVWNDTTIRWTVPSSLGDGEYPVVVERSPAGGTVQSASATFTVGTGYSGASFAFASTLSLASTPDTHFEGDMALSSATGGRIDTPAKAAVDIPPNAMEEDTEITLKRIKGDGLRAQAAEEIQRKAAGEPIEFGPEGTRFATPVTIELPYDPALTKDETKIAIHYYNPLRREWEELPSVVDRARKVVTAKTDHFSIYQPMGLAPTAASQDEFYFRDAYAFPNPSRGGSAVTFRIQPGLAETVELRVYDLSGRKVHASSDFTFLGAIDDGNGKGAQNTYDHVWGVSGVGSGVYNFVIKASQRGNKPITKSGKVGVVK